MLILLLHDEQKKIPASLDILNITQMPIKIVYH